MSNMTEIGKITSFVNKSCFTNHNMQQLHVAANTSRRSNVISTSYQRECDVIRHRYVITFIMSHRRRYDVVLTWCAYWASGKIDSLENVYPYYTRFAKMGYRLLIQLCLKYA